MITGVKILGDHLVQCVDVIDGKADQVKLAIGAVNMRLIMIELISP